MRTYLCQALGPGTMWAVEAEVLDLKLGSAPPQPCDPKQLTSPLGLQFPHLQNGDDNIHPEGAL